MRADQEFDPFYGSLGDPLLLKLTTFHELEQSEMPRESILSVQSPNGKSAIIISGASVNENHLENSNRVVLLYIRSSTTNRLFALNSPLMQKAPTSVRWLDNTSVLVTSQPYEWQRLASKRYRFLVLLESDELKPRIGYIR